MIEQAKNTFFNMLHDHAVATSRALSLDVSYLFYFKKFSVFVLGNFQNFNQKVSTPDEIKRLFDSVSYSKV